MGSIQVANLVLLDMATYAFFVDVHRDHDAWASVKLTRNVPVNHVIRKKRDIRKIRSTEDSQKFMKTEKMGSWRKKGEPGNSRKS